MKQHSLVHYCIPRYATTYPGSNPRINSYNARVVKLYNTVNSLVRFEKQKIFIYFEKRYSLLKRWRCSYKHRRRRIDSR
jgi:hypothetical protein